MNIRMSLKAIKRKLQQLSWSEEITASDIEEVIPWGVSPTFLEVIL